MIKQMKVYRENGEVVHIGDFNAVKQYTEIIDGREFRVEEPEQIPDTWVESVEDVEQMENGSKVAVSDYKRRRQYPSIADQLDYIYHHGVDAWKEDMIKPVKDANPKVTP